MLPDRPVHVHVNQYGLTLSDGAGNSTVGPTHGVALATDDDVRELVAARFANDQQERADARARTVVRRSAFTWTLPPLDPERD